MKAQMTPVTSSSSPSTQPPSAHRWQHDRADLSGCAAAARSVSEAGAGAYLQLAPFCVGEGVTMLQCCSAADSTLLSPHLRTQRSPMGDSEALFPRIDSVQFVSVK